MSSEAKRVKLFTLVELVLGVALIVLSVVMLILGGNPMPHYVSCAEGVLTFVFGVRGALIANVPARIGKLVSFGAIILLLQVVCVAAVVYLIGPDNVQNNLPTVCACTVPPIISLIVTLLARGMAKRAER